MIVNNILQAPIEWDPVDVTPQLKGGKTVIPDKAIDSVRKNFVALKGPLAVSDPNSLLPMNPVSIWKTADITMHPDTHW